MKRVPLLLVVGSLVTLILIREFDTESPNQPMRIASWDSGPSFPQDESHSHSEAESRHAYYDQNGGYTGS
jgi:hypothetical protein